MVRVERMSFMDERHVFGAHMPISGGLDLSIKRGKEVGCNVIQIFTKNSTQWKARNITDEEIATFRKSSKELDINVVAAHDSYLINLGSTDETKWNKAVDAFCEEIKRADKLGIPYLITHPGSHLGEGEKIGIERVAKGIRTSLDKTSEDLKIMILLETTAGQGTNLGYRFEHLRDIIDISKENKRLGVCFDTCHVFAAGYDIKSKDGMQTVFKEFNEVIGIEMIKVFHVNDSKKDLGSRVDRHEHIGKGFIGKEGFYHLLEDERFYKIPMILETPKDKDLQDDVRNLGILRDIEKEIRDKIKQTNNG